MSTVFEIENAIQKLSPGDLTAFRDWFLRFDATAWDKQFEADAAMNHPIYRITSVECIQPYSLCLRFNDGLTRTINLEPVLEGELYGPLRDPAVFAQVALDPEVHTVVWPCGADFDPATLHDWPEHEAAFRAAAERWSRSNANA